MKVDKDIEALVWPVSNLEYRNLEQLLLQNGCGRRIPVWQGFVIGDFVSYLICLTHHIPFQTEEINLNTWEDVLIYVCRNQLNRKDIPGNMRKYLIGKRYLAEKIITAKNLANSRRNPLYPSNGPIHTPSGGVQFRTSTRLEREYQVCGTTVQKYGVFAGAVDRISAVDRSIRERLLSGQLRISHNNLVRIAHMGDRQLKALISMLGNAEKTHIQAEDIDKMMAQKLYGRRESPDWRAHPSVKDMPAYDPDTEALSLAFTIPSWRSSIQRVQSGTDVERLSAAARQKLLMELEALRKETVRMIEKVKE